MRLTYDTDILDRVGMNAATLYEYLRFWCGKSKNVIDGRKWVYQTIKDFKEAFPNMGEKTIRRNLKKLEDEGLILTGNFNKVPFDHTKWYAVVDDHIELVKMTTSKKSKRPNRSGQNDQIETVKVTNSEVVKMTTSDVVKMTKPIPINKHLRTVDESIYIGVEPSFNEILNSYPVIKDNEDLKDTFLEFIKLRKKSKNPLTAKGLKLNINKAVDLGDNDPEKIRLVVEQTIANGWRGIFPLKENRKSGKETPKADVNPFRELMKEEGFL